MSRVTVRVEVEISQTATLDVEIKPGESTLVATDAAVKRAYGPRASWRLVFIESKPTPAGDR